MLEKLKRIAQFQHKFNLNQFLKESKSIMYETQFRNKFCIFLNIKYVSISSKNIHSKLMNRP